MKKYITKKIILSTLLLVVIIPVDVQASELVVRLRDQIDVQGSAQRKIVQNVRERFATPEDRVLFVDSKADILLSRISNTRRRANNNPELQKSFDSLQANIIQIRDSYRQDRDGRKLLVDVRFAIEEQRKLEKKVRYNVYVDKLGKVLVSFDTSLNRVDNALDDLSEKGVDTAEWSSELKLLQVDLEQLQNRYQELLKVEDISKDDLLEFRNDTKLFHEQLRLLIKTIKTSLNE